MRNVLREERNRVKQWIAGCMLAISMMSTTTVSAFSSTVDGSADMTKIKNPIIILITSTLKPALALVGTIGLLYCLTLALKLIRTKEPQERKKARLCFKNAVVGFALIFCLILALNIGMPLLIAWVNENAATMS